MYKVETSQVYPPSSRICGDFLSYTSFNPPKSGLDIVSGVYSIYKTDSLIFRQSLT